MLYTYLFMLFPSWLELVIWQHTAKTKQIREMVPLSNILSFLHNLGPNDFVALDNLLLTFPSNSAVGASVCESVTIVGDNIIENDEVFQVLVTPDDSDDQITTQIGSVQAFDMCPSLTC